MHTSPPSHPGRARRARRLGYVLLVLFVSLVLGTQAAPLGPAGAQGRVDMVGIRLLEGPNGRAPDPRARQYVVAHLAPGTTLTRQVQVTNGTSDTIAIDVYAAAATVSDGAMQFSDDRTGNDLTEWTTVDPAPLTLAPGEAAPATVTIAVPADASPGERYAVVWAEPPAATSTGGVRAVNRVGVRMYVSVGEGNPPASDFLVTSLQARRDADGAPAVAASIENTGGRALDLTGDLWLTDGPGGLTAGPFEAAVATTLGVGQTAPVLITLDSVLPDGPWTARLVARSGTLEREAIARLTFPTAPDGASDPVVPEAPDDGGGWVFPTLVAVVALLLLAGLAYAVLRRRRSTD